MHFEWWFLPSCLCVCVCISLHDGSDDFSVLCFDWEWRPECGSKSTFGFRFPQFLIAHNAKFSPSFQLCRPLIERFSAQTPMTCCDAPSSSEQNATQTVNTGIISDICVYNVQQVCRNIQSHTHTHTLSVSENMCLLGKRAYFHSFARFPNYCQNITSP